MARSIATTSTVGRAELLDFVRPRHRLLLATARRDGRPQMSPVSGGVDPEGRIVISTYPARAKTRNAEQNLGTADIITIHARIFQRRTRGCFDMDQSRIRIGQNIGRAAFAATNNAINARNGGTAACTAPINSKYQVHHQHLQAHNTKKIPFAKPLSIQQYLGNNHPIEIYVIFLILQKSARI